MATGIDVFFAGLMLICLDGQSNCVEKPGPNTAWVAKADGPHTVCGRDSKEETELKLRFSSGLVITPKSNSYCDEAAKTCNLPEGDVCVVPSTNEPTVSYIGLQRLPQIDRLDRRFRGLRMDRLKNPDYVPTRIHFPNGNLMSTVAGFPYDYEKSLAYTPTPWYRSDGRADSSLPSDLADRLRVTYAKATCVSVSDCNRELFKLCLPSSSDANTAEIVFQNFAKERPFPDWVEEEYEDLAYLLWYYRLGMWDTAYGICPANGDAILLRCVRDRQDGCAYDGRLQRDTTFWPPMLGTR